MYNELLVNELIKKFGIERTISYCQMKSEECHLIYEECHQEGRLPYEEYMDFGYDKLWWNQKMHELKQIEYHGRTTEKSPFSGKSDY